MSKRYCVERVPHARARLAHLQVNIEGPQAIGLKVDEASVVLDDASVLGVAKRGITLKAASGLLNDLRDGNAVGSLNQALASASTAAQDVSDASKRLPQLSARLEALAARAETVIAAYGARFPGSWSAVSSFGSRPWSLAELMAMLVPM